MSDLIYLDRLIKNANIQKNRDFVWDGHTISFSDVQEAINNNDPDTSEPYGDEWKYPAKERTRNYHIQRVLYFIRHPNEITGIEVDNECFNNVIHPNACIIDGWHRLFAAMYLKLEKINIEYSGREDVLDYLTGKRKRQPYTYV